MYHCRILFLFLLMFAFPLLPKGQDTSSRIDVLTKIRSSELDTNLFLVIDKLCEKYAMGNPEKTLYFSMLGLKLSEHIGYDKGIAKSCINAFAVYANRGDYPEAMECALKALEVYSDQRDLIGISICYNNIGALYSMQGKYERALVYMHKSLKITEPLGKMNSVARCYNNIGVTHKNSGNFKQAEFYYNKALQMSLANNDKEGITLAYMNLGSMLAAQKHFLKALDCFDKSLKNAIEIGDRVTESTCYNHIGNIYKQINNYDKALTFCYKALKIKSELKDKDGLSYIYSNISQICLLQKNYRKAVAFAEKAFDIVNGSKSLASQEVALERLSLAYEKSGNRKEALKYYKLYTDVKDSVLNMETKEKIMRMEMDYDVENKQREISLLSNKTQNQELVLGIEKEKKRNQFILLSVLLVMVSVSSVLFYYRYKFKQKEFFNIQKLQSKKEQLKAVIDAQEKERTRFARDVHDGIGQYFTALKYKINLLEREGKKSDIDKFEEIDGLVDELYHEIRSISFNIMPQVIRLRGLIAALEELIFKIKTNRYIDIELNVFNLQKRLPEHIEVSLYRIIQELLTNILKYAKADTVNISFTKLENELNIMIEDNGTGFNTDILSSSEGHGWKNIRSRLEMINGAVNVDSHPGKKGSTVNIIVALI